MGGIDMRAAYSKVRWDLQRTSIFADMDGGSQDSHEEG